MGAATSAVVPKSHLAGMLPPTGVPPDPAKTAPAPLAPARGDQGRGNNSRKVGAALPSPGATRAPAPSSPAVGPFPRSSIPQGQQTGSAPRSSPARRPPRRPGSPPRCRGTHGGFPKVPSTSRCPTLDTVMGFPKSLPPVMRKPQGAGPARVTITGMAAGGSGRAGSRGVRKPWGAEGTRQRRHSEATARQTARRSSPPGPVAPHRPPPAPHPEGPPSRGRWSPAAPSFRGGDPHPHAVSGCRQPPPLPLASPVTPAKAGGFLPCCTPHGDEGVLGTRCRLWRWWDGAGEVTPLSPGPCARCRLGSTAGSSWHGAARPSQRGLEGRMRLRGQPAAGEGRILLLTAVGARHAAGLQGPPPRVLRPVANPRWERMPRIPWDGTASPWRAQ